MKDAIGRRLYQARKGKNLTQEQLAEMLGMSVSAISRIETGRNVTSLETLIKICDALQIGLDELLYDEFPKHTAVQSPEIKQIVKLLNQMDHKSVRFILDVVQAYRATLN